MRTVEVEVEDVKKAIKKNRQAHRAQFDKALEGWQKAVIDHLESMVARAKKGKKINLHINLPQPEDHTTDYDRVVAMLDMEVKPTVELTEQEFAQFVQDDWGWKQQFLTTNAMYSA